MLLFSLSIIYVFIFGLLLIVLGINPQISSHSKFELQRQAKNGSTKAKLLLKRHSLLVDILSLQRVISAILLVMLSVLALELFHWLWGFIISLVIALASGVLARISLWQKYSQKLYENNEPQILGFIEKHRLLFKTIRLTMPIPHDAYNIASKAELLEIVKRSGNVLTTDEKKLISSSLRFNDVLVKEVMTPKDTIEFVERDELLGPLVLDDLYKKGHNCFPVIASDINHVVGVLCIQDLLTIGGKLKSHKVSTMMDKAVTYIQEDQSLQYALATFLATRHQLIIITNKQHETVGVLSLNDVITALLGRKIDSKFDGR